MIIPEKLIDNWLDLKAVIIRKRNASFKKNLFFDIFSNIFKIPSRILSIFLFSIYFNPPKLYSINNISPGDAHNHAHLVILYTILKLKSKFKF